MTTMIAEVYDALLEAGASQEKARQAAASIGGYDNHFNQIDASIRLLQWQVGAVWAVLVIIGAPSVWLLLRIAAKVGALG